MQKKNIIIGIIVFLLVIAFLFFIVSKKSGNLRTSTSKASPKAASSHKTAEDLKDKIIVYYFHGSYRCPSCIKLEEFSSEAIHDGFAKELGEGKLEWKVVNVEEAGNKHFIKDYRLYTKSLILAEWKKGEQLRWKNLTRTWELLNSKENFIKYVQGEVKDYLKGS